jgi:hypothetical protein
VSTPSCNLSWVILADVYAAGGGGDARYRSHRCMRVFFIVSISRQIHEAASVDSLFHDFDLLACLFLHTTTDRALTTSTNRAFRIAVLFQINSPLVAWDRFTFVGNPTGCAGACEQLKQLREGPMTSAVQAFLSAGELLCLSFAAIALFYFAEKLRSGFLEKPAYRGGPEVTGGRSGRRN